MNRKVRITFMLSSNMTQWAGGKKVVYEYVKFADRDHFDIQVLQPFPYHNPTLSQEQLKIMFNGVRITEFHYLVDYLASSLNSRLILNILMNPVLPFRKIIFLITKLQNLRLLKRIESETDYFYLVNNDLAELLSSHAKIIGSEHIYLPGIYNGKPIEKISRKVILYLMKNGLAYRKIKAFHCINEPSLNHISRYKKAFFVPNGVDSNMYYPDKRDHENIRLLFVGRIVYSKGIGELVKAFQSIKDRNLELHVVGAGELEYIFSNSNDNRIFYHGFLHEDEMAELYRQCDIFVLPTYYENFALVIIEALSSGLHVITSEQIKPRFSDYEKKSYLEYVPINASSIANAIKSIRTSHKMLDYEEKKKLHERVKEEFDWRTIVKKLYKEITSV